MGRIKEFIHEIADKRGINLEEVTDEMLQDEIENAQEALKLKQEEPICLQTGVTCGVPCHVVCDRYKM